MPIISRLPYFNDISIFTDKMVVVHGAASETITISDGVNQTTCTTDLTGKALTTVSVGKTYTLYGSVSGYTSAAQTVDENTNDLYAMPRYALYWRGNECEELTDGWESHYDSTSGVVFVHNYTNYKYLYAYQYDSYVANVFIQTAVYFDLTNYSKIYAKFFLNTINNNHSETILSASVYQSTNDTIHYMDSSSATFNSSKTTGSDDAILCTEINKDKNNENRYICFALHNDSTWSGAAIAKLYELWLE